MRQFKWIKIHYGDQTDVVPGEQITGVVRNFDSTVIDRVDGFTIVTSAPITMMYKEVKE
jgi:hypothetical protein